MAPKQAGMDSETRPYPMRSPSNGSDVTTRSNNTSAPFANPVPAYIAKGAASDLITSEIDKVVVVSDAALVLINEFLDQVLYSLILASRSMSLSSLRATIPIVLKPRLGKAALRAAEEELKEYLDDDEELELHARSNGAELKHDFDPDLAWRLARLRCMVYTRLGDLEEEDEEEWLEKEGLRMQLEMAKQTTQATIGTGPASAIFLTSVVEYLGEQALYYAAQHAQKRHSQHGNQQAGDEEIGAANLELDPSHILIAGKDMNHVGRDSPLSRLWRSYRRNTREIISRPLSPDVRNSQGLGVSHSRTASSAPRDSVIEEDSRLPDQIPLPMSGNDVDEIEVPGLAPSFSDDEDDLPEDDLVQKRRAASLSDMPAMWDPADFEPPDIPERSPLRPVWLRKRSISSPNVTSRKRSGSGRGSPKRGEVLPGSSQLAGSSRGSPAEELPAEEAEISAERSESIGATGAGEQLQEPSSSAVRHPSPSTEGIIAGAVATVANVLGIGTLGYARGEDKIPRPASSVYEETDRVPATVPESTLAKRTVAEEMLGSAASVPPPQDATTGASITNVDDFYSMHVPEVVSPDPSFDPRFLTTPATDSKEGHLSGVEAPVQQAILSGDDDDDDDLYRLDDAADHVPTENVRSAHSRAVLDRQVVTQPGTIRSGRMTPTSTGVSPSSVLPVPPPPTEPTNGLATQPPGPDILDTAASNIPARTASSSKKTSQLSHVKADSRDLPSRAHSRNSSRGTRADGTTASTQSPTTIKAGQDPGLVDRSSSFSRRLLNKPLQIADESDEAKKKSLENLIRGNETLHFTLTPKTAIRDEQLISQKNGIPTADTSDPFQGPLVPTAEAIPRVQPGPVSINPPLKVPASPVQPAQPPPPPTTTTTTTQRLATPLSSHGVVTPVSPVRSRNRLGEPRDARTEVVSSTRDLADYARSTGPHDLTQLPQPLGTVAAKSTSPLSGSGTAPTDTTPPKPVSSTGVRGKYQARDARPVRGHDSSELIDFIREGPPSSTGKPHRIDRRVAPFRRTIDSEEFQDFTKGRAGSSLRDFEDDRLTPSVDPSVSSQTPLIVASGRGSTGVAAAAVSVGSNTMDSSGMPKRTRRRIKDPYAIYDSDDEDFDDMASKHSRNQEESLIDFLRNTSPPTAMKAQPVLTTRASQRSLNQPTASGVRGVSPHLTQSGSKLDKYRPTQPTHAAHVERNRVTPSSTIGRTDRGRSRPQFEARDAKATRANTSELAEYLKNSGPAPNTEYKPQPFILSNPPPTLKASVSKQVQPLKEDNSMFKRFSKQRKK